MEPRAGFEPAACGLRGDHAVSSTVGDVYYASVDWDGFRRWVFGLYSRDWADDVVRLARRFAGVLFSGNASELLALSPATRRNAMKALSALARFLGHEWVKPVSYTHLTLPTN